MIAIDLGDAPPDIEDFRARYRISVPIGVMDADQAKRVFGVLGCPATVLIDKKGRMVGRSAGDGDWTGESARAVVRSLLGIQQQTPALALTDAKQARRSVHLVSAVVPNDPKLSEILDEAADALKSGDQVAILFDDQSIGALRISAQKTGLEAAPFTDRQRSILAKRLGVPKSAAPRNQLEYIQHLANAGAEVLVNANAMRVFGLSDAEIHPIAKRVSVGQMEQIVDDSDACYTYQHD